ncbi:Kinase-like protein [Mycena sanguinolenta]|uniref:Kinase-like protein n=1 Tax=Mycena sanguinolenta TaxID=230812 RepID=A0A8H7CWS9_9AGAR|nr:Kinase-like protein [Mycena sanguinolenta]
MSSWFNLTSISNLGIVSPHASTRTRKVEPFIKSFSFLPSLLRGSFKTSETRGTYTRKYSETKPGRQAAERLVNNYNYYVDITGGFGGSGGEGGDQGGDGGTGQGPTVYFGQPQEREPSEFRTIRLGDIKLIKEFKEMRSNAQLSVVSPRWSAVGRQTPRATVRRVYKAKLEGRESGHMTVAVYEGDGAEETWNEHLANYESIRHPNVMQLYGLVNTQRLRGMVFHDELIPYDQFFRRFQHSPILSTYIFGYCNTEFWEATKYIGDVMALLPMNPMSLPGWIQPQTGQFCLDLAQGGANEGYNSWDIDIHRLENISLDAPYSEDTIISSLSEDPYHELCSHPSIARYHWFQVSTGHPIGPGIFRTDSQHGTCVRITEPLQILPEEKPHWDNYTKEAPGELLPNLWIRYDFPRMFALKLELNLWFPSLQIQKAWLAQASHIFAELQEREHIKDYVCIDRVCFMLQITDEHDIPEGYLFICPPEDFRTGIEPHVNLYQWPACPAYWSLDPSGAARLSTEDTKNLGFPAIHIETRMYGYSRDRSVYEGLRRFHQGKGFDPESRDVARQLGYPLFEMLGDRIPFLAHKAYWSLDPSGADRLSTEDARNLGFPAIHIETVMEGLSWDCSVYQGLRQFHEGKGFDQNSGEVARRLGYPLYKVSSDRVPFPARKVELYSSSCDFTDPELCRELGHFL